jgi:zeaxanthin glucosyltransferase
MKHFGIICPPVPGHINPFTALGRELVNRGHTVTFLQLIDLEETIASAGLGFEPIGMSDHPRGSLPESLARLGRLKGIDALRFTIKAVARTSTAVCRDAPDAIRRTGIDAMLVDQMEPAGGAVADHLGLPFVTVCNALAINRDPVAPPPFTPWGYRNTPAARIRNRVGYTISDWLTRPIASAVSDYRERWRLPALTTPDDSFSKLAQICQMPRELDFPRISLPDTFHYVGPLRHSERRGDDFPWEKLDGRPIVYASLGTLQNSREPVFRAFAEGCEGAGVQLVLSHGGGLTDLEASRLPGAPLVFKYVDQEMLLARAAVTLTHAGLNTVLDSLANAVPLVTVPITYEQPAIARRVEWHGCGESLGLSSLNGRRVRATLRRVMDTATYRDASSRIGSAIRSAGGVRRAAAIIETAVK